MLELALQFSLTAFFQLAEVCLLRIPGHVILWIVFPSRQFPWNHPVAFILSYEIWILSFAAYLLSN